MKTYQEIEELEKQKDEEYDLIKDKDDTEVEDRTVVGHYIDFISDLLDWNLVKYLNEIGFDFENEDIIITDEIKDIMIIKEEQVKEEIKVREEFKKRFPYGSRSAKYNNGVNLDWVELDILKWVLE